MLLDKEDLDNGNKLVQELLADIKTKDYQVPEDRFLAYIVGGLDFQLAEKHLTEYQYTVLLVSTLGEKVALSRIEKMKGGKG